MWLLRGLPSPTSQRTRAPCTSCHVRTTETHFRTRRRACLRLFVLFVATLDCSYQVTHRHLPPHLTTDGSASPNHEIVVCAYVGLFARFLACSSPNPVPISMNTPHRLSSLLVRSGITQTTSCRAVRRLRLHRTPTPATSSRPFCALASSLCLMYATDYVPLCCVMFYFVFLDFQVRLHSFATGESCTLLRGWDRLH